MEPKVKLSAFNQVGFSANLNVEQVVYAFLNEVRFGLRSDNSSRTGLVRVVPHGRLPPQTAPKDVFGSN